MIQSNSRLLACLLLSISVTTLAEETLQDPFTIYKQVNVKFKESCQSNLDHSHLWSMIEIVNHALCKNPQTHQTWANARLQATQVAIAKSAYLPTITLNTATSRSMNSSSSSLQVTSISSSNNVQPITRFTPVISLNYLLYNFGAREAQFDNMQKLLEAANWTQDAVFQNIMFAAIQAYYQVFATQSAVDATTISEKISNDIYHATQKRHEVGTVTLADVLQAKSIQAQAKLNRTKAEGDAKVASGTLANALGLEADYALNLASPFLSKPNKEQDDAIHSLIEMAKAMRPDLIAAESTVKAAEANVKSMEAGHLPSISLVGNYGYNHTSLPSDTQSWTMGMQISVPLFTGFNTTYLIQNAKEQLEVKRANLEQLEQSVTLDVWNAYQLLNTARESFQNGEELLSSASQSEEMALGRYQAGSGNIIDLLTAQSTLATARLQLIQAQYGWLIQKAKLAQALGRLDYSSVPMS